MAKNGRFIMRSHQQPDKHADDSSPRRSLEETALLGDAIYEGTVRTRLEPAHNGEVVAIDVDSGAYVVADDALTAARDLRARHPHADVWLVRVGSRTLDRIGAATDPGGRWDGGWRTVRADAVDAHALVGMGLLTGYRFCMDAVAGGRVTIEALP